LPRSFRNALLVAGAALAFTAAEAQPSYPVAPGATVGLPSAPQPYTPSTPQPYSAGVAQSYSTPSLGTPAGISASDAASLRGVLDAVRRGDVSSARANLASISGPVPRRIAEWAYVDSASGAMTFFELDQARRDLAGWPRESRRVAAAERKLDASGLSPKDIVAWFGGGEPQTPEGAFALAGAYRALGKEHDAHELVRKTWREKVFEADVQRAVLSRFPGVLSEKDHVRRADMLLFGSQGPAARDMIGLLPEDHRRLAEARIAFRSNAGNANDVAAQVPSNLSDHPGLAFERAAYLRRRGLDSMALALLQNFPKEPTTPAMADRIWDERYQLTLLALRNGDSRAAYGASANSGLTSGGDAADAEFYAGWIALRRLNDPKRADEHFANLERIGQSPITRGRALYWRGRAHEAKGDKDKAQGFYGQAARYYTTFYGQLAAERVGDGRLVLPADPAITPADRARFEGRDTVQALRILWEMGLKDQFRALALGLDDVLPTVEEEAMLIDLVRGYGEQDTSMKVVRSAAQRGFVLPDRGYPTRTPPQVYGAPETALTLGITRQESGFDPKVRSGAGARGMMQLMPATATIVARKVGVSYSPGMLDDPDYNMRLGQSYLGEVIDRFSGSYVMGIASYNAGPGRPAQWSAFCGDPRTASADPIDFIECIPFGETRNYVMRVMEGMQIYRAKLAGGSTKITLSSDLRRGAYGYSSASTQVATQPPSGTAR
jgi:soluble lytic murein transglycosylase